MNTNGHGHGTWDSALGTVEIVYRICAKIFGTIDSIVDSGANYFYITSFRENLQNHDKALRFVYIECFSTGRRKLN